jgi:hypothetical protein
MRITVLTDERGEIIGTMRPGLHQANIGIAIQPEHGQKVHHLAVPDALGDLKGPELHEQLRNELKKAGAKQ